MTATCRTMEFPPVAEPEPSAPAAGGNDVSAAIDLARNGDASAFAYLVSSYGTRTLHFVLRIVGNRQDAEDVTQETFVKAWKSLPRYRHQNAFCTWLFTIARRTALNHLRRRRSRPVEVHGSPDPAVSDNARDESTDSEGAEGIWEMARRLSPDQYQALWLCYGEDLPVADIARIMSSSSIRIRVLLHRARRRMARWLRPAADAKPPHTANP